MGLSELVKKYVVFAQQLRRLAGEIASQIAEAVKSIVDDLEWYLCSESGMTYICFRSESRSLTKMIRNDKIKQGIVSLGSVIGNVFPEIYPYIVCVDGVYLTKSEAEKAVKQLEKLR